MLSVWWPVGQLVASLGTLNRIDREVRIQGLTWVIVAWGFIPNYSCTDPKNCKRADNMGWRYFILTLGALTFAMFICRFFLFHLYESPKV
jgi:hypothetical protein